MIDRLRSQENKEAVFMRAAVNVINTDIREKIQKLAKIEDQGDLLTRKEDLARNPAIKAALLELNKESVLYHKQIQVAIRALGDQARREGLDEIIQKEAVNLGDAFYQVYQYSIMADGDIDEHDARKALLISHGIEPIEYIPKD